MKIELSFWRNASTKRKRLYSVVLVFVVAVLAMALGSAITLSQAQAEFISDNLNRTLNEQRANNNLIPYIFLNNFRITLLMFIPLAGAALGLLVLFNTGVALNALAMVNGYPAYDAFFSLMATPVFWLEFAAYSIAMAESIWLFRRLLQRRWRELKWVAASMGACALLLIIGAAVEAYIVTSAG
ncbi:MAG: stage II sporulation protein M [Methanocella sp.]